MASTLGFIGLGVMGEPMCRNLAQKSGMSVVGCDTRAAPLDRLAADGVTRAANAAAIAQRADIIFLSLPGGDELGAICRGKDGLLAHARAGQIIIDLTTAPVGLTRELAAEFAERGVDYADAPVARTRQAARDGTLSVMVGATDAVFKRIEPLLGHIASDITHCGGVGCGQMVKILNNMVLIETVVALSEALSIARRAGLDGKVLFETLAKGSADSFALRNHGMKALLPNEFPLESFSTRYARKDLSYALELARDAQLGVPSAKLADELLAATEQAGWTEHYWPAVIHAVTSPGSND